MNLRSFLTVLIAFLATGPVAPASEDGLYYEGLGEVRPFALKDQTGRAVTLDELKGKIWIASLFYSTCPECPTKHMPQMRRLYKELAHFPGVLLVSVSVNPAEDDPEQLARYAKSFGAESDRWLFLTGDRDDIYELSEKSFKLARPFEVESEAGSPKQIIHAFRFLVVDESGTIRGTVDGTDPSEVERVRERVKGLLQEKRLREGLYFPTLNAALNGVSGVLLLLGYALVRNRRLVAHKVVMLLAVLVSAVFLGCYLYYHFVLRDGTPSTFLGHGWVRPAYFTVLLSHTVLAAVVAPLALIVTYLGFRDRLRGHVRLARWTLPLWLYVSVTGVLVYWMLYHL